LDALVAQGRAATRTILGKTVAKAIVFFEQAVRTDPKNASAYFSLARAHENLAKGRALNPASIDGLQLLADLILHSNHDYACAKRILETALTLDPKDALSNHQYSQLLSGMGEFDRAFQYADTALAYASADTRTVVLSDLGRPHYIAGQYDRVLTKYYETDPNAPLAHFYRSLAYGSKGLFSEALDEAKAYRAGDRARDAGGIAMIALAYANAGQQDSARVVS